MLIDFFSIFISIFIANIILFGFIVKEYIIDDEHENEKDSR
jgi:hypothetical protein